MYIVPSIYLRFRWFAVPLYLDGVVVCLSAVELEEHSLFGYQNLMHDEISHVILIKKKFLSEEQ